MKAYFVRKAADREVVGLFVAASTPALASLVDECCDPAECEYAPASAGGLMVAGSTAVRWPVPGESGETGLEEAVFTQQWDDDLRGAGGDLDWKPLGPAAARMLRTLDRRGGR